MCFSSSCHSCEISPSFKADWQNLKTPASHYCVKLQLDIKLYFCWFCQCLDHEMMMWLASCLIHSLWDVGCDAACCLPSEKVYIIFFHCGQRSLNHEPIMCNYFHTAVEYLQNVQWVYIIYKFGADLTILTKAEMKTRVMVNTPTRVLLVRDWTIFFETVCIVAGKSCGENSKVKKRLHTQRSTSNVQKCERRRWSASTSSTTLMQEYMAQMNRMLASMMKMLM